MGSCRICSYQNTFVRRERRSHRNPYWSRADIRILYSTTSSARASTDGGIVRPIAALGDELFTVQSSCPL
jgi:hypothetical protein